MYAKIRRDLFVALLSAPLFFAQATSSSTAATIDFESFADIQNINGVNLGGVTVTNPSGNVEIYDNRFGVGSRSGTKAIGSFTSSSSLNPMIFTFDVATDFIELFAGDGGGDTDSWSLEIFDAVVGGNSLGILFSGDFTGNPYVGLAFNIAGILRAEANWTGTVAGIGFDDLSFNAVPLPAALPLFGTALAGMGLLGWRRKRKAAAAV